MEYCTFLQKLTSLRTSASATSWGVVTISAPSTPQPLSNCNKNHCVGKSWMSIGQC